jgi:hypothetical protein
MPPNVTGNSKMPATITVMLLIGLGPLIYFTLTADIGDTAKNMMSVIVGAYLQYTSSCVQFFVGTTFASGAKDTMIYHSTPDNKHGEK